jgi:hypothetical protein
MQDQYTGLAGTYIVDPETGTRKPSEELEAPAQEVDVTSFSQTIDEE